MSTIIRVSGTEILDSRGNPTVEAEVLLADGFRAPSIEGELVAAINAQLPTAGRGPLSETLALANEEAGSPRTRFTVSPSDYLAVEESADARGLLLLGFWHSHPDHPARPSATDRSFAWPGLLTLVIAVEGGEPRELTAWDVPGHDGPFRQLHLDVLAE